MLVSTNAYMYVEEWKQLESRSATCSTILSHLLNRQEEVTEKNDTGATVEKKQSNHLN